MKLHLLTWNSQNINDGTIFKSYIPPGQRANLSANAVTVNRAADFPFLSTTVLNPNVFIVGVQVAAGYNINTARELMKQYFDITDRQRHTLVAEDQNDSNKQYYLTGLVQRIAQEGNNVNSFFVTLQVEYPYWQLVTASVDSWDITASGDSDTITNAGNIDVPPVFTITPTTTKTTGLKYRRYVTIYNNMDKAFAAPLDITNGGLDVQTLIDANKMRADGYDFRVWEDGAYKDRWLSGMDSDSDPAKCWTNENLQTRHEGAAGAAFDSDDTTLSFAVSKANLQFLRSLKMTYNKTLLIDSEILVYADSDIDTVQYQVANISRGQKGTTATAHTIGATVRHLEHDPWIMYGDSDAGAPDVDDDYKPIFDLTSTNAAWAYTNYYDVTVARPGAWKGEVISTKTGLSYTFTDSDNTFTDPSNVLGLAMMGAADFQVANEAGTLDWIFSHPCGVTDIAYSASLYNTSSWTAVVGLQYLQATAAWFTAQNEAEPAVALTWEDVGPRSVSLGGTYETIRFVIDGQLDSVVSEKAMAQFYGVTCSFDSDNLPTVSVGSEQSINFFEIKLTNNATGEYIKVTTPCPVNTSLTVDCANKRAYLADGTPVTVVLSSERVDWLNLVPGANPLQWDDTGTVAVHVNISHRDRVL